MNVKQLRAKLQTMDDDAEVMVANEEICEDFEIVDVCAEDRDGDTGIVVLYFSEG